MSTTAVAMIDVAKKPPKPKSEEPPEAPSTKQMAFRVPHDLNRRIEDCAHALGLDSSNLLRMLIVENLPQYERRAEEIRAGNKPRS